jgi:hypothetical protein
MPDQINDGRNDFDFFMGSWKVSHQRLRERLVGCTEWEEFESECTAYKILGGLGNFDEITMPRDTGMVYGATLRLFNPVSQEWSIYWADSVRVTLDVPMIGKFENGVGMFYAHETHAGKHVYSRFIWSNITANTCQWEQALSTNGGATWETNWVMKSVRTA